MQKNKLISVDSDTLVLTNYFMSAGHMSLCDVTKGSTSVGWGRLVFILFQEMSNNWKSVFWHWAVKNQLPLINLWESLDVLIFGRIINKKKKGNES